MKMLYVQIFAAVTSISFVGATGGVMYVHQAKREVERKLGKAESDLKQAQAAAKISILKPKPPSGDKDLERATLRIRELDKKVALLESENALLKESLRKAQIAPPPQKPVPGSSTGHEIPPILVGGPAARDLAPPPPPAPDAGPPQPWGDAEDAEMDEMAAAIKLSPEQREEVKKIILEAQNEFERKLIELNNAGTARDITDLEKVGEEVSKKTETRIDQLLYPEQKTSFARYMKGKRGEAEAGSPGPSQQ